MPAPSNDNFSSATDLGTVQTSTVTSTNVGATREANEPFIAGHEGGASIWYKWTAPYSTEVSMGVTVAGTTGLIGVYIGSSLATLQLVAEFNNQTVFPNQPGGVSFIALAGQQYKIAIDAFHDNTIANDVIQGEVLFSLTQDDPPNSVAPTLENSWDFDTPVWYTNCEDYPDFVGSSCLCPYIAGGQIRKMIDRVNGLDHLEGELIKVQMDGILPTDENGELVENSFEVLGGEIQLPKKAAVVHAGLGYTGKIQLLKSSEGSQLGTGQFKMRRVYLGALRLYRSLGLKIGLDEDHLDPISDDDPALPLYTGDIDKLPNANWDKETEMIIQQEEPLPAQILAIILRSEVEEKG